MKYLVGVFFVLSTTYGFCQQIKQSGNGTNIVAHQVNIYKNIKSIIQPESDRYLLFLGFQLSELRFDPNQQDKIKSKCTGLYNLCQTSLVNRIYYFKNKNEISNTITSIINLLQESFKQDFKIKVKSDYEKVKETLTSPMLSPVVRNYSSKGKYSDGLAWVMINNQIGYVDGEDRLIIPANFDLGNDFSEGVAAVSHNHKFGFINIKGNVVVNFEYDYAFDFYKGSAIVKSNGLFGIINKNGGNQTSVIYTNIERFRENNGIDMLAIVKDGKMGIIRNDGSIITEPKYDDEGNYDFFDHSLLQVAVNGQQGFIDGYGREIVPCIYEKFRFFHNNICAAKKDGKWGYIDLNGKVIIPFQFDSAGSFSGNTADVTLNGQKYTVDRSGTLAKN